MELVVTRRPVYQAGTLSGNPLAMTAGIWSSRPTDAATLSRSARSGRDGWRLASPTPRARPGSLLQVNALARC